MTSSIDSQLANIAQTAARGLFAEAALEVERLRANGTSDPRLAALGGAVEFRRDQFDRAVPLLREAHGNFPGDTLILANLIESLYRSGDTVAAYALCANPAVATDKSGRLQRLKAFLAQETGHIDDAIDTYRAILAATPDDWSSWNNLGNAYSAIEDYPAAVEALQKALDLAPDLQPTRINLGHVMIEGGDPRSGEAVLREAADRVPDDPIPMRSLYELYWKEARDDEALEAIAEAAKRGPGDAALQCEYAREAAKHNDYDTSDTVYRRVLALDPGSSAAFVGLANNLERTNRDDAFDDIRREATAAGAAEQVIAYIDALHLRRVHRYEEALKALDRAGDIAPGGRNLHSRGVLLDRLGRFDEAFGAFAEMNELQGAHPSEPRKRAEAYRGTVAESRALLSPDWVRGWTPAPSEGQLPSPVFLGGFPRSGTTLLDTMLMSLPGAIVLEEQPYISQMQQEAGGLASLAQMSPTELSAARDKYWERVAGHGEIGPKSIVIDKQPLHTNNAAAIARIFPKAKFILALRHPCDVILSCFMTNFRTNHAMANFLDLDVAAELYAQTFSNWEQAVSAFDLDVHTVVYERLVEDTSRELRPLFDWLRCDWLGDDLDHRHAARARGLVTTASYSQVTEPIYQRARGRWHNYEHFMEPVFPILRPWVEKFGYSLNDGRIPPWPHLQAKPA